MLFKFSQVTRCAKFNLRNIFPDMRNLIGSIFEIPRVMSIEEVKLYYLIIQTLQRCLFAYIALNE